MFDYLDLLRFPAQADASGVSDFFSQIGGLVAVTCGAGVLWLIMMGLVIQRTTERKRRAQAGLPPLPGYHVLLWRWLKGESDAKAGEPESSQPAAAPERAALAPAAAVPIPDLDLLTTDLAPDEPLHVSAPLPEPSFDDYDLVQESRTVAEMLPDREELTDTEESDMPITTDPIDSDEPPGDAIELLRVWRDLADGGLIVEIGGQRFRTTAELRGAGLERRFVNAVRELDRLAGTQAAAPLAPAAPARPPQAPPPAKANHDAPSQPVSLAPGSMLRQMTRAARGQAPEKPEEVQPELSIADQIEALLQARLRGLPEFRGREIHVQPSMEGGVKIEVDGMYYAGIGDVEDSEVRSLLGDVVREWESQQ
ncbi:MAG: hypothetical protein GXY36_05095 [Chloroflexi bacterium]|nr:hypothetical protein [Chloroflexota bacterium]